MTPRRCVKLVHKHQCLGYIVSQDVFLKHSSFEIKYPVDFSSAALSPFLRSSAVLRSAMLHFDDGTCIGASLPARALQVAQHSPVTYLQKSAGQPVPQLPSLQAVQLQFLPSSSQHTTTQVNKSATQSKQNGSKGSTNSTQGAGAHKVLQLPLLRPAPPVLAPFAGMHVALLVAESQ